jgi:photosystem II stability/assembly factor-like uncharacterized protein
VYRSNDGGTTWASVSKGLGSARIELTLDPKDSSVLYAETSNCALYRTRDQGATWDKVTDRGCQLTIDPTTGALYRSESDKAIRSVDGGRTWTEIRVPENGLHRIVVHPQNSNTLFAVYQRQNQNFVYISSDSGQNWQPVSGVESIFIANLFFDHQQGNVVYTFGDLDAFQSTDGGRKWSRCTNTGSWHAISPSRLAVDPRNSERIVLATRGDGVLFSPDGCRNWGKLGTGLGNSFVNAIVMDPANPDVIYVGTDGGAFYSMDGGEHWLPISEGLGSNPVVYSIAVDAKNPSRVYAATPDGVFRLARTAPTPTPGP